MLRQRILEINRGRELRCQEERLRICEVEAETCELFGRENFIINFFGADASLVSRLRILRSMHLIPMC
jgi:hypothetical protein